MLDETWSSFIGLTEKLFTHPLSVLFNPSHDITIIYMAQVKL